MRKILEALVGISILLAVPSPSGTQSPGEVVITRWIDPLGRQPLSFQEFIRTHPQDKPFTIATTYRKTPSLTRLMETGEVALVVEASLYPHIQASLDQYTNDLILQGYTVTLDTMRGGTPQQLRQYLQSGLPDIVGAVLIGDLPVAWYDMSGEEFPIDYYFMDLDGTWTDFNGDGLFDSHSGSTAPEIWVGRLMTSRLAWGDKVALLRNYFEKNHAYRQGILTLPQRALAFDDDDWMWSGTAGLELAYSDVTVVNDSYQTNAANYKNKLRDGYEFVHIMSHSCPWSHTFLPPNYGGTVYNYEIHLLDPQAFFYNLFACSNVRFVEVDNLGNWYIFVDTHGLWAVGSTKTGAMHPSTFDDFYTHLGTGSCLGDAFKIWYDQYAEWDPYWHYGMAMLGDPTLHIQPDSTEYVQQEPQDPGERMVTDWTLHQVTTSTFSDGQPAIALAPSGWVWIAWASGRDVRSNIYESHYNGTQWSAPAAIAPHEYWDLNPELAVDGAGRPWVIWHSFRDYPSQHTHNIYSCYHDGVNWSSPIRVSSFDAYDLEPAAATDSLGRVWVAFKSWRDANADIYASYYTGSYWTAPTGITTDPGDDCGPAITVDRDGNPWVFWYSNRNGDWDLYSSYYNGSAWSLPDRITSDPSDDLTPSATVDTSGWVWVLWKSYRNSSGDIYSKYFDGSSWSTPIQVTSHSEEDISPSVTCTPANVLHCVWRTNRDGNWEVYESCYEDSSWSPPSPVTAHPSPDMSPVIASDNSGQIWTAWQTERSGNWDIYAASSEGVGMEEVAGCQLQVASCLLHQNYPNPFTHATTIRYSVPRSRGAEEQGRDLSTYERINLSVYDLSGRLVKTLVDGGQSVTSYQSPVAVRWDGRDSSGMEVANGVYFCRLRVGQFQSARSMVLLR